jgi:hypothetical protein
MLDFLKRLGKAVYACTIGGLVRLCKNTTAAKVDAKDKEFLGRVIVYTGFAVFAWFFPGWAILIGLLRFLAVTDFIRTIADIFQHTANSYA